MAHPVLSVLRADALGGSRGVVRAAVLVWQQGRAAAVGVLVLVAVDEGRRVEHVLHPFGEFDVRAGVNDGASMSKNWSMSRMTWDKC